MLERWGVYYSYVEFVKEHTPENAHILVPPQESPWYSTGNVGLNRYFLFPRILTNGTYDGLIDFDQYDYIMLVWGEWLNAQKDKYGWPKSDIPAEKTLYFNPDTKQIIEVEGVYDPKNPTNAGTWGLIKIKK